jgi:hypothetical protein
VRTALLTSRAQTIRSGPDRARVNPEAARAARDKITIINHNGAFRLYDALADRLWEYAALCGDGNAKDPGEDRTKIEALLPLDLRAYLDKLFQDRERVTAATEIDEWARVEATPSEEEISRLRGATRPAVQAGESACEGYLRSSVDEARPDSRGGCRGRQRRRRSPLSSVAGATGRPVGAKNRSWR